jgi:Glycine rich protein
MKHSPTSKPKSVPHLRRLAVAAPAMAVVVALATAAIPANATEPAGGTSTQATRFDYAGTYQTFTVPHGVYSLNVTALGGGGGWGGGDPSRGAEVRGTLPVKPGETLIIGVGGNGQDAPNHDRSVARGGWGGLGSNGGDGSTVSGNVMSASGAGGGGTSIQVEGYGGPTILAGGGGGGGGRATVGAPGAGGNAGTNLTSAHFATGSGGGNANLGGSGGKAASQPGAAGDKGGQGTLGGGNGAGGGGGYRGGGGGDAGNTVLSRPGGGGGAGSTYVSNLVSDSSIGVAAAGLAAKTGEVSLSWSAPTGSVVDLLGGWGQSVPRGTWSSAFSVRVTDAAGTPVPNTAVTFTIKDPSLALFPGSQPTVTVTTDASGVATAPGFQASSWKNGLPGHWAFDIVASAGSAQRAGTFFVRL